MKKAVKAIAFLMLMTILMVGCSSTENDLPVSNLKISTIVSSTSTDTSEPPLSYSATISWDIVDINNNEIAAEALTGLEVSLNYGSADEQVEELAADVTEYTFTGLEPGDSCWLTVKAIYDTTAMPEAEDSTDTSDSVKFLGGPWFTTTNSTAPTNVSRFSVGSFNNADSMPTTSYTLSDVYYYNSYNSDYQFESVNEDVWFIVDVNEVTDSNEDDRNNVQYLNKNFQLLDASVSGLTDYSDIAEVDVEILDIYGDSLLSISGTDTEGTMSTSDFSTLISSVDSGYYADKTGYYFIKATCKSMPDDFSDSNSETMLGIWGFANNGAKR
jgi:hypothetical protein